MSEIELKPCPFCGGEAGSKSEDVGWDYRGDNVFAATVGCTNCGVSFELEHHGDDLLRNDDIEDETCHALEEQAAAERAAAERAAAERAAAERAAAERIALSPREAEIVRALDAS